MWQEIAIIIIALIVIIFIGRKLYNFLSHPPAANNPCCGCTGCALKEVKKNSRQKSIHPDQCS